MRDHCHGVLPGELAEPAHQPLARRDRVLPRPRTGQSSPIGCNSRGLDRDTSARQRHENVVQGGSAHREVRHRNT